MYSIVLSIHIVTGTIALLSAIIAILVKYNNGPQKWHVRSGRVFFGSMIVIFMSALWMAVIRPNLFLLLIAIFSMNFAFAGFRYAKNKTGKPALIDWARVSLMKLLAVMMFGVGGYRVYSDGELGIVLIAFGILAWFITAADARDMCAGGVTGKRRIAKHLTAMFGATIATVTAVAVVNIDFEPAFIVWLAPSVIIAPIISWWNVKVLKNS